VINEYLVRERDRRRLRELVVVLLAILPVGLSLLGYVWVHVEVIRVGYRVHDLEGVLDDRRRYERSLEMEATHLSSPRLIERRASEELGMRRPEIDTMVFERELP
jgi:hypothetical protein